MQKIYNFRDFGGLKTSDNTWVKTHLLFRSGSLERASLDDLRTLQKLDIRTVVDLRTIREQAGRTYRLWEGEAVRYYHVPVHTSMINEDGPVRLLYLLLSGRIARLDFSAISVNAYREMVTDFKPEMAQVLRLASEPANLPLLIHCTAGKDRTGFVCALIQSLLGVSWEGILEGYLRSNDLLSGYRAEMQERLIIFSIFGAPPAKFLPVFEARQDYLEAAFRTIVEQYGTAQDFALKGLGLDEKTLHRLRVNLVD